jgi:methylenetetrahydrofolate reductase (NADPH)
LKKSGSFAGFDREKLDLSFEFYPPKTEKGEQALARTVDRLARLEPDFVSVTFGAGGSAREGTLQTCLSIVEQTGLTAAPHISCVGSTKKILHKYLERYRDAGFRRLFVLRGDVPSDKTAARVGDFAHANELVAFVREFGGFEINVACYPEFHPESPDPQTDMENFVRKVDAGADMAVTQYFFNNASYYRFVEDVRRMGVEIPIVVGLMPLANFKQIDTFSKKCGADIPLWIRKRMEAFQDDPASQLELGVDIATRQVDDLLRNGAPGVHFYTLNKAEASLRIWERLGLPTSRTPQGRRSSVID